jgi:hypothetical protein
VIYAEQIWINLRYEPVKNYFITEIGFKAFTITFGHTVLASLNPFLYVIAIGKKAVPLQAWTGPEGSRRLKLPDF